MKKLIVCLLALAMLLGTTALADDMGDILRVVNCKEYITLREAPDTHAGALDRIPLREEVDMIGRASNGFTLVAYEGQVGYALSEYLKTVESYEGERYDPDADECYNINLFLSNFTEQGFLWRSGCYDSSRRDTALLTDFAIDHCWFNRTNQLEWADGEYFDGYNVRLPESQIAPIVKKYFGVSIKPSHSVPYVGYRDGYYYWEETGGHTNDGFACLTYVERLDRTRYSVWFNIYGMGEDWDNEVCHYSSQEAENAYPTYGGARRCGRAIIDTGSSGLDDRDDWTLERITINREDD